MWGMGIRTELVWGEERRQEGRMEMGGWSNRMGTVQATAQGLDMFLCMYDSSGGFW